MSGESSAPPAPGAPATQPRLSLADCVGIAVNGIIGSGIFLLPQAVYRHAGGRAPLAWLIVGGLCFLVGLCFAEAARYTDRSGGPYRYASLAFGKELGYAVGFVALASTMLSYATVVRGFTDHLAFFVPSVAGHEVRVGAAMIALLGAANLVGLKPGAWTSDFLSIAKLVPLLVFVGVGLFFVDFSRFSAAPVPVDGEKIGLLPAAMAALFACTGFEFVPVPAGETHRPQRAVPIALLGGLGGSILLYVLVQVVMIGTSPDPAHAFPPLAMAARSFGGPAAEHLLVIGAMISAAGFCAGSVMVGPRYLAAFADDGMAPAFLSRRRKDGVPVIAIVVFSLAASLFGNLGDFNKLADVSNLAVVAQYLPTCIAVMVLRRQFPNAKGFKLPAGPLIPLCAAAGCAVFLTKVEAAEYKAGAVIVAVGFLLRALSSFRRRTVTR